MHGSYHDQVRYFPLNIFILKQVKVSGMKQDGQVLVFSIQIIILEKRIVCCWTGEEARQMLVIMNLILTLNLLISKIMKSLTQVYGKYVLHKYFYGMSKQPLVYMSVCINICTCVNTLTQIHTCKNSEIYTYIFFCTLTILLKYIVYCVLCTVLLSIKRLHI